MKLNHVSTLEDWSFLLPLNVFISNSNSGFKKNQLPHSNGAVYLCLVLCWVFDIGGSLSIFWRPQDPQNLFQGLAILMTTLRHVCLFHPLSPECTVEFSRGSMTCENTTDRMQRHINWSSYFTTVRRFICTESKIMPHFSLPFLKIFVFHSNAIYMLTYSGLFSLNELINNTLNVSGLIFNTVNINRYNFHGKSSLESIFKSLNRSKTNKLEKQLNHI